MNISVVYVDADGGADLVETLDAGGTGIDGEHIVFFIENHFQNVGVSADEDVRQVCVDELESLVVVPAGISAYVHHQHLPALAFEVLGIGDAETDLIAVAVAVYSLEGLERRYLQQGLLIAEVPRMPYLIHWLEELLQRVVEPAVCVGYYTYVHTFCLMAQIYCFRGFFLTFAYDSLKFSEMKVLPYRIGHGYDVHALGEGLELWLGGVRIPHTKGCIAHSDGDVAIHALCDAMLGALALGDIGQHFPDTSDEFKGIDSRILLRRVNGLIRGHGYEVANADITIAAQRPKLAGYIGRMRETLAGDLEVDVSQVSVKATTTEHLGFTGREEGIAVWASVLLAVAQE